MDPNILDKLKVLLTAKQLKIAVAESLTCGRLQAALGVTSGVSDYFEGGVTAYNIKQKISLLGIDEQHAQSVNSVSQQVAFELASGACRLFESDIGIGTTGYAEPSPENGVQEPMAYIAICRQRAGAIENVAGGQVLGAGLNRVQMQEHVSAMAIESLIDYLEACPPSE